MKSLFVSKESVFCLLLILLQQVLVALSTLFLAEIAKSIASGKVSWVFLSLFIGTLTTVYIPATFSRIFLEKVRYIAHYRYSLAFVEAHKGQIHLNNHDEEEKLPYIASEGQLTINCISFFFYDLTSTVLNVVASLLALSYVLDPIFIFSYGLSFGILFIFVALTHKLILHSSDKAQQSRANLLGNLLKSWQNVTINNVYNFNLWKTSFDKSYKNALTENVRNESVKQAISSLGMVVSMVPILFTIVYFIYASGNNLAFQALLIATLPRQIQMIQNLDLIIQNISEWTDIKQRLVGLKNALKTKHRDVEERIKWDKIHFSIGDSKFNISSFEDLESIVNLPNRITIRGENGSGKSTLLKCIKARFGGYYLPTSPKMSFENNNLSFLSTGEQIINAIKEICSNGNEKLILLDEWDANLDSENRQRFTEEINKFKSNYTIIEAVHRE